MMNSLVARGFGAAVILVGALSSAQADTTIATPSLVSFGVGYFDVLENIEQNEATDFRFEYRSGKPLAWVLKPLFGVDVTTDKAGGAFGGVVADWVINDHWVVSPSFAAGLWANGDGKDMGSAIEFRSQMELGYRFDNDWRITGAFSHMSNADIGDKNPGVEQVTLYLHMPADKLFP